MPPVAEGKQSHQPDRLSSSQPSWCSRKQCQEPLSVRRFIVRIVCVTDSRPVYSHRPPCIFKSPHCKPASSEADKPVKAATCQIALYIIFFGCKDGLSLIVSVAVPLGPTTCSRSSPPNTFSLTSWQAFACFIIRRPVLITWRWVFGARPFFCKWINSKLASTTFISSSFLSPKNGIR